MRLGDRLRNVFRIFFRSSCPSAYQRNAIKLNDSILRIDSAENNIKSFLLQQ